MLVVAVTSWPVNLLSTSPPGKSEQPPHPASGGSTLPSLGTARAADSSRAT